MSQEEFADRCGFARSYMSRLERGKANPSLDAVEVLAVALGIAVEELFIASRAAVPSAQSRPTIIVPFASDGSCFNPMLRKPRAGTFAVGPKSQEVAFTSFEAALDYLKAMDKAKWRRPNRAGNWGCVSAVKWAPLPKRFWSATNFPSSLHTP